MDLTGLLEMLCEPVGAPGREDEVRDALASWLEGRARRLEVDRMGNLQAWLGAPGAGRVMLDAHMDETALMVQHVGDDGMVGVTPLGGIDARIMPGSKLILQPAPGRRLPGVVTVAPPHVTTAGDREKAIPWEKLFVDLGMRDAEEAARAGVEPGTPAVLDAGMGRMGANAFQARNLDDRAGCAALLALIERLQGVEPKAELVFNFASAEEVGLRGAGPAAFSLKPDLALVVECTMGDTPGLEPRRQPARMGRGPAVTVADGRMIAPLRIVKSLEDAARRAGAPCQRKLPGIGGTDAGAIHTSRGGVPTGVVSIPARYIHSPVSLLYLDDLAATVDLVAAWLDRVDELL